MNTRHVLSAFAVLCLGWLTTGCEVENCKRGELGCIEGKPDDGECKFGLVAKGDECVEPGSGGSNNGNSNGEDAGPDGGNGGEDGGTTGQEDRCGGCEGTNICVEETRECVDFCETPDELPGSGAVPTLISCGGEADGAGGVLSLGFDQNCKARCQLDCRWREWFCGEACTAGYCDDAARIVECQTECPANVDCIAEKCREAHGRTCDGGKCKDNKDPVCTDIECSNECDGTPRSEVNLFDGFCDDGSYTNSASDFCPYGTDCADCGPRREPARPEDVGDLGFGELCPNPWRCDDHTGDNTTNSSWCLLVPGGQKGLARCMPDCSEDGEECPPGYACYTIANSDGTDATDANGVLSRGCFPNDDKVCM